MTETINGLHRCQPKNEPVKGETKSFLVVHMPGKNGKKPWIKIKSESQEKGGSPYRVVSVEPTGWEPDDYGNVSYNLEIEAAETLGNGGGENTKPVREAPSSSQNSNGVDETRKHLMQSVNLYNLCVDAVDKCVKPHINNMDGELYQAAIGTLFIEASHKRTTDGINWWSYVEKMPTTPLSKPKVEKELPF